VDQLEPAKQECVHSWRTRRTVFVPLSPRSGLSDDVAAQRLSALTNLWLKGHGNAWFDDAAYRDERLPFWEKALI
jgi:hypothetical protein